jgi:hypothetical protein
VEKVVRSLSELSDEFCIELITDPRQNRDVCTVFEAKRIIDKRQKGT